MRYIFFESYIFFSFLELSPLFLEVFVLFLSCIFSFLPIYENMFVSREFPWGGNCHRVPIHPTNNLGGSLYNILSLQLSLLQNPMNAGLYECFCQCWGRGTVSGPFHSKTSRHGNCCTHLKELWQNYIVFTLKGGCSSNSFPSWVFPDFKIVFMTSLQSNPTGLEISSHWIQSFYFSWPAIDSFTGTQVWLTLVLFEKSDFSYGANKLPLPKNSHIWTGMINVQT